MKKAVKRKIFRTPKYKSNNSLLLLALLVVVIVGLIVWLVIAQSPGKTPHAAGTPGCTLSTSSVTVSGSVKVTSVNGLFGSIGIQGAYGTPVYSGLGTLTAGGSTNITIPSNALLGLYVVRVGGYAVGCTPNLSVNAPPPPPQACSYKFSPTTVVEASRVDITILSAGSSDTISGGITDGQGTNIRSSRVGVGTITVDSPKVIPGHAYVVYATNSSSSASCSLSSGSSTLTILAACQFTPSTVAGGSNLHIIGQNYISGDVRMQRVSNGIADPTTILLGSLNGYDVNGISSTDLKVPQTAIAGIYVVRVARVNSIDVSTCKYYPPQQTNGLDLTVTAAIISCLTFEVSPGNLRKYGDVNNNTWVNSGDATLVNRSLFGIDPPLTGDAKKAADVNGNGVVNSADATLILQFVFGQISKFPIPGCT